MHTICFEKRIPQMLAVKSLRPLWPGVIYSRLSPTKLLSITEESLPGQNWVRVRNRLCGICATDLHLFRVEADPQIAPAILPGTDRIYLGHEVVGEVIEVGSGSAPLQPGDRVVMDSRAIVGSTCFSQELAEPCRHCRGGNLQLCENTSRQGVLRGVGGGWGDTFTAHCSELYRVPDALDDEAAMMIEPLSVGVHAVLAQLPVANDRVLVVGCGVVGLNVIQTLRALSPACHIAAMARYPQQIELAQVLGADDVIANVDGYEATVKATGGNLYHGMFRSKMIMGGFDIIYDCVGSAKSLQDSLRWARAGGTVVLVGVTLGQLQVDLTPIWYQEVRLIGILGHGMDEWQGTRRATYDITCELLLSGKLRIKELITHQFPLVQWQEAIKIALDKRSGAVKVVFDYVKT